MAAAPRGNPEGDFQIGLVRDLRLILAPPFRLHHSPNENRRAGRAGDIDRAIASAMGVLPGFPDLVVMQDRDLFMELKTPTGVLSPDQRDFRDFCLETGRAWALVRTLDEALAALRRFNFRTRIKDGI
jgi:hypothetical protein